MTNVPPATPPVPTGAITASPNTQEGLSQQQQNAGQRSAGGQTPRETTPPPSSPAVTIAASLAGLREGMRFKGTMMGSDANGLPVLKTPNGTFILSQVLEQLALNGDVDIEIRVAGNKISALILAIGGKAQHPPKEIGLTMTSISSDGSAGKTMAGGLATGPAPRGGQLATLTTGSQLTANVVNVSTSASSGPTLEAGSTLVLKITGIALALPKTAAAVAPGTTPVASSGTPSAGSPVPGPTTATQAAPSALADDIKTQLSANQANTIKNPGVLSGNANRLASQTPPAPTTAQTATSAPQAPQTPNVAAAPPAAATQAAQGTNSAVVASATSPTPAQLTSSVAVPQSPALSAAISQSALLSQQNTDAALPATTSASAQASAQASARSIQGEIIGQHRDGGLLVRTAMGDISLVTRAVLPPGSQLTFETVATRTPDSIQRPISQGQLAPMEGGVIAPETQAAVKAFPREWPALKEVMAALQTANPAVAQNLIAATMPGANSSLASSILLFLTALRGGNIKGWLGNEATLLLERGGHDDLLNRLTSDAAQMGRASEQSGQGDWRALPFPMFDGSDLQQIWAFVREHRRFGDQADKKALRFVVELELTALGGMQLDGLIQDKQFDLIVRNSRQLPVDVRQNLTGLFEGSVEATGFSGSIIFQSETKWPVSPFREAQQEAAGHGEIVA